MIRKLSSVCCLFAVVLVSGLVKSSEPGRLNSLAASMVLKVVHVEDVRKKIIEDAQKAGGFKVLVTDTQLLIKIPPRKLSEMMDAIGTQGLVMKKTIERKDLTQEIAQLQGALRSKQEMFTRLEKLIDQSDLASTLNIEKTMGELVGEIEQTKGILTVKKDQARWAVINISFQFRARQEIVYVSSPFDWLNSVDLTRFVEEF